MTAAALLCIEEAKRGNILPALAFLTVIGAFVVVLVMGIIVATRGDR